MAALELTASAYTPVCRAQYYAELAASSPAAAETIASTHRSDTRRDGQAEWAWVAWINTGMTDPPKVATKSPLLTELDVA